MPLQLGEIVEGIGAIQFAGMDQAHEQIADVSAVFGFIEQGVLAVKDRPLQTSFADVVVQRCAGLAQKQGQPVPVLEQVGDRLAQTGVRLNLEVSLPQSRKPMLWAVRETVVITPITTRP